MVERVGLLTIIVLGEVVIAVVNGWANVHNFDGYTLLAVCTSILFAILMRRIYFDLISHHLPIQKTTQRFSRMYLHLPLTMSLVMLGSGLLMMIENWILILSSNHTLFILSSIVLFLLCVFALTHYIQKTTLQTRIVEKARHGILLAIILMTALFLSGVAPLYVIIGANLLLLSPILFWFSVYLSSIKKEEKVV
jgi:low temperature requirement protein LtrA